MQLKETREALNKFAKYVIQQARTNLTKNKGKKKYFKIEELKVLKEVLV